MAEYDFETSKWQLRDTTIQFHAFSRQVILESGDFYTMGGIDDTYPSRPEFKKDVEMVKVT